MRRKRRTPSFTTIVLLVPLLYMTVVYVIPVGQTLLDSATEPVVGFGNFTAALTDPIVQRVLLITLRISVEVAVICLVLGLPVAYFMSRLPARRARLVALLVIIPFWTSVLVRSFAWIVLLGDDGVVAKLLSPFTGGTSGLLYSEPAVVISMVHVLLPFTILIIKSTLDQIDYSLMRAARTLGAGPVRAFVRVYLPLAVPAAVSGTMLVFIMGLGYYITPALVGGPRQTMIAMLIERKVNVTFDWPGAAALSTMLLVASVVLYFVIRKLTKVQGLVGVQ
ncbi:ABC transporter permease [Nakamurella lactea]|uniref:ABC transporter permease n=1 Tax=Nakamurella lactea TaxID=459515 RepID=UPI001378BB06|nr:ABC transporter permease [Nakamurella lactea]